MLITTAHTTDFSKIKLLSDITLGEDYLTEQSLEEFDNNELNKIYVAKDACNLIGFATIEIIKSFNLTNPFLATTQRVDDFFNDKEFVGVIKQLVVNPNHQQKGIGSRFLEVIKNNLPSEVNHLASACWMKGENTGMVKLLKKVNFKLVDTVEDYWKKDSINRNFICPICGNPPCVCPAEIYAFSLA